MIDAVRLLRQEVTPHLGYSNAVGNYALGDKLLESYLRSSFDFFVLFELSNTPLRTDLRSTKPAMASTPIETPLKILILELQLEVLPCEGALERSDPSRDSALGWSFREDSPLSLVSSAKNSLSRGSTFFFSIIYLPLIILEYLVQNNYEEIIPKKLLD